MGVAGGFFDDFALEHVQVRDGLLRVRHGGSGPPLLLVHGNPQTHAMWHRIAPALAKHFRVVCPDIRGYGGSLKPPATADHSLYAKREMARDLIELMAHFGFERFQVVAHDRGARISHRLALDHPAAVTKLAVLDIVPTIEHFERADMAFGLGYYHWFWFAQPHPFPEMLITKAPEEWFFAHTGREPKGRDFFAPDALADYLAHVRDPDMIRGMCEDYRAAASIDLVHDRESRSAGLKLAGPLLVVGGAKGKIAAWD
ncbi:MAG: alpha/beta hydrolase, partial [Pseudolabrys sp.]|nr:alpha/beta hydrolase [Pseudolabrys sp.]